MKDINGNELYINDLVRFKSSKDGHHIAGTVNGITGHFVTIISEEGRKLIADIDFEKLNVIKSGHFIRPGYNKNIANWKWEE